jgi:hypothetical protein
MGNKQFRIHRFLYMLLTKSTATSDRNNRVKSPNLESKQQEKNLIEKKSGTKQCFGKPNR